MKGLATAIACVVLVLAICPVAAVVAGELHLSPSGDDANPGTIAAPLRTLQAARDMLRENGWPGHQPCTVILHAGTYRLSKPFRLTPRDGGTLENPVIYRAADGAEVIVTGAQDLNATWTEWKDGIYRARVGNIEAIDQLFVDAKRQPMARYPNFGSGFGAEKQGARGAKAGTVPYDGSAADAWDPVRTKNWKDPTGAFMHGMHRGLWGGMHYQVTGKKQDGTLEYVGGWQNNRSSLPHDNYRMIENVFEELDAAGEWFHDGPGGWLYYMPEADQEITSLTVEIVQHINHLVELYGDVKEPVQDFLIPESGNGLKNQRVKTPETTQSVKHIRLQGLTFRGTRRTFMETKEPILRSDWTLYRGGAVHLRGTEQVAIEDCRFEELGGNALFVDGYNRNAILRGNVFTHNGATDVNIVGSLAAVRSPFFSYNTRVNVEELDTTPGPKTDEYPADILVENNFMTRCGRFEKQTAGVNISMSSRVTVRHNTISHTPRAAINICDGTWGGHLIEWNDCFETVLETHDHGAFNSWGRDRFWLGANPSGPKARDKTGKAVIETWIETHPDMPRWDAYQTTVLRNNRMHCDHGWDIDLDDGSTNYEIYNNLCLSGGLKTREGYYRIVKNNVILNRFTCNVSYPGPTHDVFTRNIIWGGYAASDLLLWGGLRDKNFFHNPEAGNVEPAKTAEATLDDADSLYGNAKFIDPENADFRVATQSPALQVGFENFPMTGFGVTYPALKALTTSPPIRLPREGASNTPVKPREYTYGGATMRPLLTDDDITATGMFDKKGVFLIRVTADSPLADDGFQTDDVVLAINGRDVASHRTLADMLDKLGKGEHTADVWRGQESIRISFTR